MRKRKIAKTDENTPTRSKDGLKGELFNAVKVLTDMAVKIVDKNEALKTVVTSSNKAIEDAIGILNNLDGVEVGSPFYYRRVVFLSDFGKNIAWLKMPPEARLGWLIHCVEKTN